jgi:hypothetical protein
MGLPNPRLNYFGLKIKHISNIKEAASRMPLNLHSQGEGLLCYAKSENFFSGQMVATSSHFIGKLKIFGAFKYPTQTTTTQKFAAN